MVQAMSSVVNYEVFNLESMEEHPYCPHGPTILLAKGDKKSYVCSACRDHKLCNVHCEYVEGRALSAEKMRRWRDIYDMQKQTSNATKYAKTRQMVADAKPERRAYCRTCETMLLLLPTTEHELSSEHQGHDLVRHVSEDMMRRPLLDLLTPIEVNSSNAVSAIFTLN